MQGVGTRTRGWLVACLLAAILLPEAASAQSAARKAGRGLAAMTCGFLEVPGNIVAETRSRGAGWGLTLGFATGVGKLVVRELVGVYEFVTAPFAIPAGYQPIIQPEFPWDYFERPAARH
jgi:putative exosortase-associated protein (TIGR04073 family)